MPDFPNELVEAAAILLEGGTCERCDGEGYIEVHSPSAAHAGNPDGSHDEYCPDCCASGRAGFRRAAALIEQRVMEEAGDAWRATHGAGCVCADPFPNEPESFRHGDFGTGVLVVTLDDARKWVAGAEQRVIDRLAREADGRVQRLQDAIHAADRELITIADFSIQEAADAIDSVRAGLKDAAETDVPAPDDARSVPDQFPAIDGIIDRLAAEAGSKRARTSQLHRIVTLDVAIEAVREGAACGVAAERARADELRAAGQALADLIVKEDDGMGREWYELASHWREVEIALSEWAALSPERATATDSLTEAQPVTEEQA